MIDNVYGGSEYLTVSSSTGSLPYFSPTQPMSGMMRFHNNQMQVYDGNSWLTLAGGTAHVGLSFKGESVMKWAEKKMAQEAEWQKLAETNNAVKIALDNMLEAQKQLETIAILSKDTDEKTS